MTKEAVQWTNNGPPCNYYTEFSKEALEIINSYIRKYNPSTKFYGMAQETMIRYLLYAESIGYRLIPEQRDYFIKTSLGIIRVDKEYEKEIGYFG